MWELEALLLSPPQQHEKVQADFAIIHCLYTGASFESKVLIGILAL